MFIGVAVQPQSFAEDAADAELASSQDLEVQAPVKIKSSKSSKKKNAKQRRFRVKTTKQLQRLKKQIQSVAGSVSSVQGMLGFIGIIVVVTLWLNFKLFNMLRAVEVAQQEAASDRLASSVQYNHQVNRKPVDDQPKSTFYNLKSSFAKIDGIFSVDERDDEDDNDFHDAKTVYGSDFDDIDDLKSEMFSESKGNEGFFSESKPKAQSKKQDRHHDNSHSEPEASIFDRSFLDSQNKEAKQERKVAKVPVAPSAPPKIEQNIKEAMPPVPPNLEASTQGAREERTVKNSANRPDIATPEPIAAPVQKAKAVEALVADENKQAAAPELKLKVPPKMEVEVDSSVNTEKKAEAKERTELAADSVVERPETLSEVDRRIDQLASEIVNPVPVQAQEREEQVLDASKESSTITEAEAKNKADIEVKLADNAPDLGDVAKDLRLKVDDGKEVVSEVQIGQVKEGKELNEDSEDATDGIKQEQEAIDLQSKKQQSEQAESEDDESLPTVPRMNKLPNNF